MKQIILLLFLLSVIAGYSQGKTSVFKLRSVESGKKEKVQISEKSVVVFLSPECPLCINYSKTLVELQAKYFAAGIKFTGVFPGTNFERETIQRYAEKYKLNFPLYIDKKKKLTQQLAAEITPEVFVIGKNGKVVYQGLIDNWVYAPGKVKPLVTEFYLKKALEALINGKPPVLTETTAIGCFIE